MVLNIMSGLMLALGVFFFAVGTIGLIRLPDTYTRMHATTKCDTLGVGLVLFSLALQSGFTLDTAKLALIVVFIWVTNPTATHVIAKAVYDREMQLENQAKGERS